MAEQRKCKKLAAVFVEHQDFFAALSDPDCQWAIESPQEAVALFVDAIKNRAEKVAKKILEFVVTVSVPTIESFKASDHLKVDTSEKSSMKISWLGENLKKHFLGKVEGASEATELKINKLLRAARDLPKDDEQGIIPELCGRHEITLGQFFWLLRQQGKGQAGELLVNGWANIAYIRDDEDILWAVRARWYGHGWYVEAGSVGRSGGGMLPAWSSLADSSILNFLYL